MVSDTADTLRLMNSINFEDSAFDGFGIDLFKVTILVCVMQTAGLQEFGLDPDNVGGADLAFHFRGVRSLSVKFDNIYLLEAPYLDDGELAAIHLGDFLERFSVTKVGQSGLTGQGESVPVYELAFGINPGRLVFQFTDVSVEQFIPAELDTKRNTFRR